MMADLPVPVGPTISSGTSLNMNVSRKNIWRTVSTVGIIMSFSYMYRGTMEGTMDGTLVDRKVQWMVHWLIGRYNGWYIG